MSLRRRNKYPKQYSCCNDTIIGCGLLCCKRFDKFVEEDALNTESEAESHFIWEKTVDEVIKQINGSLSWASAGLLAAACQAVIVFNNENVSLVASNWIYFAIIFIFGVLASLIEHCFESPETIAKELEIKVPKKKAALGDVDAVKKETTLIQKAQSIHMNDDKFSAIAQILKFVKIEGNVLLENMENLFIAILSNVIALALNDAVTATFNELLSDSKAGGSAVLTAQWIFVFVLVNFVIFVSVKLGALIDRMDIKMFNDLKKNGLENSKASLLQHSSIKRIFKLCESSISLVLAWALRDAMKSTILSIYGDSGSSDSTAALWTYTLTATIIVGLGNAINARYYLLYPRDANIQLQFDTDERKIIGNVLYKNAQAIVGIAWYDVFVESPENLSDEALERHRIWILFVAAFGLMIINSIAMAFWTRAKTNFQKKQKGVVRAFFDSFENWFDPQHVLDCTINKKCKDDQEKEKVDRKLRESFFLEFVEQTVDLMIFAIGFASGWLISAAVKALLVKSYEGIYNPDEISEISGDVVWSIWVAFFCALIVSTLIMTYSARIVQNLRERRHEIFGKWKKELEEVDDQIDKELELLNENEDEENGQTNVTNDVEETTNEKAGLKDNDGAATQMTVVSETN